MTNNPIKISPKAVWVIIIAQFALVLAGALCKLQHYAIGEVFLIMSLIFYFSTLLILISDMAFSNMRNKTFWILCLVLFGYLAAIIYLVKRDSILSA